MMMKDPTSFPFGSSGEFKDDDDDDEERPIHRLPFQVK